MMYKYIDAFFERYTNQIQKDFFENEIKKDEHLLVCSENWVK